MGARACFPQFDDLTADEFARLLRRSKLSREEKTIATQLIRWHMSYIDAAAIVHMDRRTVARKMNSVILPELERMMQKQTRQRVGA